MDLEKNTQQPLAEVFGFPIDNQSERALRYRQNRLCPFNNIVASCTKNSLEFPLGVCSLYHKGKPVIICPVRFREDWKIISDAAAFIFEGKAQAWTQLSEIRLKDKFGKSAGNIDYVLVAYDDKGRILDFGSLEVQAVYISGNLSGSFSAYLDKPETNFAWNQALKYPKPDYLSSSRKRLVPQIIAKGSILKQWGKKQAVALQNAFFQTLPTLPEVEASTSDFAFFIYDLVPNNGRLELQLCRIVYTQFALALEQIAKFEAGTLEDFTQTLQQKLDAKQMGFGDSESSDNLIIE